MKTLKTLIMLVFCCLFALNTTLAVPIEGTIKIDASPYVEEGVTYEDDMYGKVDYKLYKLEINSPQKVSIEFNIEAGTASQAIEYQVLTSKARGYQHVSSNDYTSFDRTETFFKDTFDVDIADTYILKIKEFQSKFLGEYDFKIIFECADNEYAQNSSYECVNAQWVLKKTKAETQQQIQEQNKEDICQGCLINSTCYDTGRIMNNTYCSDANQFLPFKTGGKSCQFDYECDLGECKSGKCAKKGFIARLIEIIKDLF